MTFLRHKKPSPSAPPAEEPLPVKKIVEKSTPKTKPKPKPLTPSTPIIPPAVQDALSRIETKLDALIKKDAEVHKKIEKPAYVAGTYDDFDEACEEAKRISSDLHCVQYVNKKDDVFVIEDHFDEYSTEVIYNDGVEVDDIGDEIK